MDEWVKLTAADGNPIYVNRSRATTVQKAGSTTYIRFGSADTGPLAVRDEPEYILKSKPVRQKD